MINKLWLAFMCGPNSLDDLKELVLPHIDKFDGLVVTCHAPKDSPEGQFLESVKKNGEIIYAKWIGRHDHSRNRYLWEGPINEGDFLVTLDTLERISDVFISNIYTYLLQMMDQSIDIIYYYSKPYLIRYREDIRYINTPHENITGMYSLNCVELSQYVSNEQNVRINVRPVKRLDKNHFVLHYLKYYLQPASNQCMLGAEHRGDPRTVFIAQDKIRLKFRDYLRKQGFLRPTTDDVISVFKGRLDDELKYFINNVKCLNDVYRLYVLGDFTVKDEHKWETLIKI